MGRAIVAVIVGYLTIALLIIAMFPAAYAALGADGVFQPGTYEITGTWATSTLAIGFLAAMAGGYVCTLIGRRRMPARALALLILSMGLAIAIPAVIAAPAAESKDRDGDVSYRESTKSAHQPGWIAILNPLIGAAGVMAGARWKGFPPGSA